MKHLCGCTAILSGPQEEGVVSAEAAWRALNYALLETAPSCNGRAPFTADQLSDDQRAECAVICASCPVAGLCNAYATSAKVPSGFWAGHLYTPKGKQ